jgi:hypothetical protein
LTPFLFLLRWLFLGHFESMLPKFTCMHAWVQHVLVCYAQAYLSITLLAYAVSSSPLDVLCLCFMRDPCQTFSFHSIHVQSCSTNHPCCLGQLTSNGTSLVDREISIINGNTPNELWMSKERESVERNDVIGGGKHSGCRTLLQ